MDKQTRPFDLNELNYDQIRKLFDLLLKQILIEYGLSNETIIQSLGFSNGSTPIIMGLGKYSLKVIISKLVHQYEYSLENIWYNNIKKRNTQAEENILTYTYKYTVYYQDNQSGEIIKRQVLFDENFVSTKIMIDGTKFLGSSVNPFVYEYKIKKETSINDRDRRLTLQLSNKMNKGIYVDIMYGELREVSWNTRPYNSNLVLLSTRYKLSKELTKAITYYIIDDSIKDKMYSISVNESFSDAKVFINKVNLILEQNRYFTIELPKELSFSYNQYLSYFSDYVEKTKNKKITVNTNKRDDSTISVHFECHDNLTMAETKSYLNEYTKVITAKEVTIEDIVFENNLQNNELNFLLLDLRNKNRFLASLLENAKLKNSLLEAELADRNFLPKKINELSLDISDTKNVFDKKYFQSLIAKSRITKCIEELLLLEDDLFRKELYNDLLLLSAKNHNIERKNNINEISFDEYDLAKTKIIQSLTWILEQAK